MSVVQSAVVQPLPASIELLPSQVLTQERLKVLLPAGTRVYLTDIGKTGTEADRLSAALRIRDAGCIAVPHLAARRIKSRDVLERRIADFTQLAGVRDVLVIGGSVDAAAGPYESTMDLFETGLLDRFGITDIAVAGHPEGSPDFTESVAMDLLERKRDFAERTGARLRIVTQFGFNPARVLTWAEHLVKTGIEVPVHIGVAGPVELIRLIEYARLCGVENSLSAIKRSRGTVVSLATGYSPDAFVRPIEDALAVRPIPTISQIHVFPFGGPQQAARWLRKRGSWSSSPP